MPNRDCTQVFNFKPVLLAQSVKCQCGLHTSAPPQDHTDVHTPVTEKAESTGGGLPEVYVKGHMLTGQRDDQFSFENTETGYSVKKRASWPAYWHNPI